MTPSSRGTFAYAAGDHGAVIGAGIVFMSTGGSTGGASIPRAGGKVSV